MRGRVIVVAVTLLVTGVDAQQGRSVFRSEADLTHFAVTVTDRRGNVVPSLSVEDFEIVEDGEPQTIKYFARLTEASGPDFRAGLMLDTSESMIKDLEMSRTAAIRFLNRLPDAKDLTLVDFDTDIRVGRFSQENFPRLVERIRSTKGEGWTALYDAFVVYVDGAVSEDGHHVLVAFTDGGDSRSASKFGDVITAVRASANVMIYIVGFLENQSSQTRGEQRVRLERIADESGGRAIFPYSMKQIDEAYDRIVAEIHGQYSLGYVSSNPRRDGRWRSVKIRLRKDSRDLRVRTRSGYFAPPP
jgi:Ca-activated chloride channel family protein